MNIEEVRKESPVMALKGMTSGGTPIELRKNNYGQIVVYTDNILRFSLNPKSLKDLAEMFQRATEVFT